jgi:hypothetical protein
MTRSRPPSTDKDTATDALQKILRTDFGSTWMESALRGKAEQTTTGVFVEADSLQNWAKEELRRALGGDDIRKMIAHSAPEPFEIFCYFEAGSERGARAAKKLQQDGLRVRIVDRRGPWPEHHSEDYICADASDILPFIKHLVLVCGSVSQIFVNLLAAAKKMGCKTTVLSFSAPRKSWPFADHFVKIQQALVEVEQKPAELSMDAGKKPNLIERPRIVILPVRPDEESAVISRMTLEKRPFKGKHGTYKLGRIRRRDGMLCVAIKRIFEQGNIKSQDAARDAIEDLEPDWIVLIGIGGGIPANEFTLGMYS